MSPDTGELRTTSDKMSPELHEGTPISEGETGDLRLEKGVAELETMIRRGHDVSYSDFRGIFEGCCTRPEAIDRVYSVLEKHDVVVVDDPTTNDTESTYGNTASEDPLDIYLAELARTPLLTRAEEQEPGASSR